MKLFLLLVFLLLTHFAHAGRYAHLGVANNSYYYLVLSEYSFNFSDCSDECYAVLPPKTTTSYAEQWIDILKATGWARLDYDVCQSISYDDAGQTQCENYLGHLGVNFTPNNILLSAEDGVVNVTYTHNHTLAIAIFIPTHQDDF